MPRSDRPPVWKKSVVLILHHDIALARPRLEGYAKELLYMVGQVGADHVGIGTDIEGVGPDWAVNDYWSSISSA